MPAAHILKDAPLVIPFIFDASSIPLSSSSSNERYPSPIPAPRPTAVASYGFDSTSTSSSSSSPSHAEYSTALGRRGVVVGCDDGTLWIVPYDDEEQKAGGGGGTEVGVEEEGGGDVVGSSSFPLPSVPKITTTDSELPSLKKSPTSPTPSSAHRFPRPSLLQSRSSSPKPSSSAHHHGPLLPHATPTGRNRVLSTSSIASNHTAYSINSTTPHLPAPASSSTLVNKGRIVSGLSATVAAPPTITTGEETLGERKDELRGLLEQASSNGSGGRGARGRSGGSISSILTGGGLGTTSTNSLEDVLESLPHSFNKPSSSPPPPPPPHSSNLHHVTSPPNQHHHQPSSSSPLSSTRSSFSSSTRPPAPAAAAAISSSSSSPFSPSSEDFVKLPQSPTTLPAGGLPHVGSSRHSFSSRPNSPGFAVAIPFASRGKAGGGGGGEVKCSEGKRVVHVLPGVGIVGGEGGVQALEVLEKRGWVVCLLGSG